MNRRKLKLKWRSKIEPIIGNEIADYVLGTLFIIFTMAWLIQMFFIGMWSLQINGIIRDVNNQIIIHWPIMRHLPDNPTKQSKLQNLKIYAYTASKNETDGDPCNTASGLDACNSSLNIIACNGLNFGTPISFDGKVYQVFDRMAPRYGLGICDILVKTKAEARQWGIKNKLAKVYN